MQHGLQDETFDIIYIPELKVTLPLHLGANDENMANGAAVLGQTSVPVGGVNTNSVIIHAQKGQIKNNGVGTVTR